MNEVLADSSRTLADRVFSRLQDDIVRGVIAPGSKVSETDLAGRYGVSRGPLREAVRRLESRKLPGRSPTPNRSCRRTERSRTRHGARQ